MEQLNVVSSICSIISLMLSIFTAQKVYRIYKKIENIHSPSIRVGGDMSIGGATLVGNHSKINGE